MSGALFLVHYPWSSDQPVHDLQLYHRGSLHLFELPIFETLFAVLFLELPLACPFVLLLLHILHPGGSGRLRRDCFGGRALLHPGFCHWGKVRLLWRVGLEQGKEARNSFIGNFREPDLGEVVE